MKRETIKKAIFISAGVGLSITLPNVVSSASSVTPSSGRPEAVVREVMREPMTKPVERMSMELPKETVAPAFQGEAKFALSKIVLEGNTVLSEKELSPLWEHHIGQTISTSDLPVIAQAITTRYREKGYVSSQALVIPQTITPEGVIRIKVIEGYVEEVEISSKDPKQQRILETYISAIKRCKPFNINKIEKYLMFVKSTPGFSVRTVISPSSQNIEGASKLTIVVDKDKLLKASIGFDNRGSKYLGPNRLLADSIVNNLVGAKGLPGSKTLVSWLSTADFEELKFIRARHTQLIGSEGIRAYFETVQTYTKPGEEMKERNNKANMSLYNVMVMVPVIQGKEQSLKGRFGMEVHQGFSKTGEKIDFKERVTSLRLGGLYNRTFASAMWEISGIYSKGLKFFGAPLENEPLSRPNGKYNYQKLDLQTHLTYNFTKEFSFFSFIQGQYSPDSLLSSEEFGVGGEQIGRGYDASEITGDTGVAGLVELRYDLDPGTSSIKVIQPYVSFDMGRIWHKDTKNLLPKDSLSSVAAGVRNTLDAGLSLSLEASKPLTRTVTANKSKNARFFFSVSYKN